MRDSYSVVTVHVLSLNLILVTYSSPALNQLIEYHVVKLPCTVQSVWTEPVLVSIRYVLTVLYLLLSRGRLQQRWCLCCECSCPPQGEAPVVRWNIGHPPERVRLTPYSRDADTTITFAEVACQGELKAIISLDERGGLSIDTPTWSLMTTLVQLG